MKSIFSNIPKNWTVKNIPEVFFFQEGPGVRKWQFRDKGIKLLNGSNINNGILDLSNTKIHLDESEANGKYKHFLVNEGDLIIASSGVVVDNFHNKIAFVRKENLPLCMNTSTIRFQVLNDKLASLEFLKFFLKTIFFKIQIGKLITGSAQLNFGPSHLQKIQIPLPPLEDQIRIAAVLTRAEKLIAKRKESIKALDEFLKSTFLEMFGDPVRMCQQPKTKLNKFIVFLTSGSRGWAQYYSEKGELFIRINNVRNANLKLDDLIFVTPPNNAEAIRTKVKTNDLLFSITADLGRTAVVSKNLDGAFINQHLALIRLAQDRIHPMFVAWFFAMPYGKSIVMKKNREGVKAGLSFDDIRGFEIVTPPLPLQTQFASIVEKVESLKSRYAQSLTELENLYGSLSQRAFKGELDLSGIQKEGIK